MTGTYAAGAYLDASNGTVINGLYLLQVWIPDPPGFVVGVTDIITETGTFAADFTYFGHDIFPLPMD